jgi:hypothetical protein
MGKRKNPPDALSGQSVPVAASKPNPEKIATPIEWVVMDLGNGFSKILASGLTNPIRWRSVQGRMGHRSRLNQLPQDWTINWNGTYYVFGEQAYTECPDTLEDFPTTDRYLTDWYKRTFAFGLHKAFGLRLSTNGQAPHAPQIIASIPAKEYSNSARKEAIEENLFGQYSIGTVLGTTLEVEVSEANLVLIPEGVGSYLYMVAQRHSAMEHGLWAVLDLGYLTGDVVFFRDGEYVTDSSDSDDKLGMITVAQRVAAAIRGQGGPDLPEPQIDAFIAELDPRVESPCVEISGVPYAIHDVYHQAMTELGDRAVTFLKKKCAGKNLKGILLTGGNARWQSYFIQPQTQKLPAVTVCIDGENGNILGAATMAQAS